MRPGFLITAGPTRERIDPVRFISNHSTGTFGYALAREASRRGYRVTLISGPVALTPPQGVRVIRVESALDMLRAVRTEWKRHGVLIMAAAVSDWRVARPAAGKIKKAGAAPVLKLVPNPDIIRGACRVKRGRVAVGFALETGSLEKNASKKLKEKNLDIIIANKATRGGRVFGEGKTEILMLDSKGGRERHAGKRKAALAKIILDKVLAFNI